MVKINWCKSICGRAPAAEAAAAEAEAAAEVVTVEAAEAVKDVLQPYNKLKW